MHLVLTTQHNTTTNNNNNNNNIIIIIKSSWRRLIVEKLIAYVEKLFEWIAAQIDDPKIFPEQGEFGKKFRRTVRKIITRMFRVYALSSVIFNL
jgi:hypothetical protein